MKPTRWHLAAMDMLAFGLRPEAEGGAWTGLGLKPDDFPPELHGPLAEIERIHREGGPVSGDGLWPHAASIFERDLDGQLAGADPAELVRRLRAARGNSTCSTPLHKVHATPQNSTRLHSDSTLTPQQLHNDSTTDSTSAPRGGSSIWGAVREYALSSGGWFSVRDVYTDLSITGREDRQLVSKALAALIKNKSKSKSSEDEPLLEKDPNRRGYYRRIEADDEAIDWFQDVGTDFGLKLPLGLSDIAVIGPRNIILLEGCGNAGKSAFALDCLARNLDLGKPLFYVFSEGSPGEIRGRFKRCGRDFNYFARAVQAFDRNQAQHQLIGRRNPDGLSVVDFLEPPGGEFYRLGPAVSDLWHALGSGVALVCVQKKTGSEFGRGGEALREKPRLALTLDLITKAEGYIVSALKIVKCKTPRDPARSPDGKEIHFAIVNGLDLVPLSSWHYCRPEVRQQKVPEYRAAMAKYGRTGQPAAPSTPHWQDRVDSAASPSTAPQPAPADRRVAL